MKLAQILITALSLLAVRGAHAGGFVLLDYRSPANLALGQWFDWVNPHTQVPYAATGQAFTLTYRVEAGFMSNQDPVTSANAAQAVVAALQTWSQATNGFVRFQQAPWSAVENRDSYLHPFYSGPSQAEFCGCAGGCFQCWPQGVWPGWGADIDVFARPVGFSLVSNGFTYTMTSGILGFTAVHRTADGIWSVDIYLNQSFAWTTDPLAARSPTNSKVMMCPHGHLHLEGPVDRTNGVGGEPGAAAGTAVFDIQTVVLHELGHALGLDHPNEACSKGAAMLDPFTFGQLPCGNFNAGAVMHGAYTGVNRTLKPEDVGGIAFLYAPSLFGDLDSDNRLTVSDLVRALQFLSPTAAPSPYDVNLMDFLVRNGRVDLDEVSLLAAWIFDPLNNPPGQVPLLHSPENLERASPSEITLNTSISPWDVGLSVTADITISMQNPQAIPIGGWNIGVVYDNTIFSNPRITNGNLVPGAAWAPPGPNDGNVQFAKLGFGQSDSSTNGVLGTLTFDVNLAAAGAGPPQALFLLTQVEVVATAPAIHTYGDSQLMEVLTVNNGSAPSYFYDANADNRIDIEDLYIYNVTPFDVSKNGQITAYDSHSLTNGVRRTEPSDVVAP